MHLMNLHPGKQTLEKRSTAYSREAKQFKRNSHWDALVKRANIKCSETALHSYSLLLHIHVQHWQKQYYIQLWCPLTPSQKQV